MFKKMVVASALLLLLHGCLVSGADSVPEMAEAEEILSRIPVSMKSYSQYDDETLNGEQEPYTADYSYDPETGTLEIQCHGLGWYYAALYPLADYEASTEKELLIVGREKEEIIFAQNPAILGGLIRQVVLRDERATIITDFHVADHKMLSFDQEVYEQNAADPLRFTCQYLYDAEGHLTEVDTELQGDWKSEAFESIRSQGILYFQYEEDRLTDARFPFDNEQDVLDGPGSMIYDEEGLLIRTEDKKDTSKYYRIFEYHYTDWGGFAGYTDTVKYESEFLKELKLQYDDKHRLFIEDLDNGNGSHNIIEYQYDREEVQ